MTEIADHKPTHLSDIGVVVVTYHPEGDFCSRLQKMAAQGAFMVVVDNASNNEARTELNAVCQQYGWSIVSNSANLGVGAALNQGVRCIAERGLAWALLFDQDSEPLADMSRQMLETLHRHPLAMKVSIIGISYHDPKTGVRHQVLRPHPRFSFFFQKASVQTIDLHSVTMAITSGSLLRVSDFFILGPFDEGFFIDYIDTDFCLRCRRHGRLIAISAAARMEHSLGSREVCRRLGMAVYPLNHPALRHYYIARNRIRMWRRYGWRYPHWWLFDVTFGVMNVVRVLVAERQRRGKLAAMVQGTWDGLLGRSGALGKVVRQKTAER